MIKIRIVDNYTVYDLLSFDFEDDLPKVIENLRSRYEVSVINKLEGPDTTIWDIDVSGYMFHMINNNWGTYLKPFNSDAKDFIDREIENLNILL